MKVVVKKSFCLIFIVFLAFVGCKTPDSREAEFIEASINPDEIVAVNIYLDNFYGSNPNINNDERTAFTEFLKRRFGLDLMVGGIGSPDITRELVDGFGGLIKINRSGLRNWAGNESISPMTDLLKDNETWNSLPWYFKDNGMVAGELWGIPAKTLANMIFISRFIRNDWLADLALEVPQTTDRYYACMKAFVYDDPDGNGLDDTIGFTSIGLSGLADIFNSYDCRISPTDTYKLAWDPIKGRFVDGLRSENIEECLSYLNSCYGEGLLHNSFNYTTQFSVLPEYYKGKTGSVSQFITYHDEIEQNTGVRHDIILGLKGEISEKLIPLFYECSEFYMLSSAAKNKRDAVNKFVDVFLGDETGYFAGVYGLLDTVDETGGFSLDGETVILDFEIEDNRVVHRQYPNILSGHPVYSKYETFYENAGDNDNLFNVVSNFDRNISRTLYAEHEDLFYLVNDKYRYTFDYSYYSGTQIRERDISNLGTKVIMDSIMGKVDIRDALKEYEKQVAGMGLDRVLERVNEDIAKGKY